MHIHIRIQKWLIGLLLVTGICAANTEPTVVAGVAFDQQLTNDANHTLQLNGAGLRRKWFFDIYSAGLYLPEKLSDAEQIIALPATKQIHLHFLRNVSQQKLATTLDEGFAANHTQAQLDEFSHDIATLKSLFKSVQKGDLVVVQYTPDVGTRIWLNGTLQGEIPGFAFHQAIMRVWLGEKPADQSLKQAFLN